MGELKNEFAFSFSRFNSLVECQRKFYLSYYGHWNGWNYNASKLAKKTYRLKQLSNLYFWVGNLVHDEIERTIRDGMEGQFVSYEKSLRRMGQQSKREFGVSEIRAADPDPPAKMFGLKEHLNGGVVDPELKASIWNRGKLCLSTFFGLDVMERLRVVGPGNILAVDNFSKFPVILDNGKEVQVYSVPDLAFRENGKVIIYDWKTGKEKDGYEDQVALYALYASRYWKVDIQDIEVNICYLLNNKHVSKTATPEWITKAENKIKSQSDIIMRKLVDQDHERNEALPAKEFSLTKDEGACYWCTFDSVCGIREFKKTGRDPMALAV